MLATVIDFYVLKELTPPNTSNAPIRCRQETRCNADAGGTGLVTSARTYRSGV